jgi:hypothetical protein
MVASSLTVRYQQGAGTGGFVITVTGYAYFSLWSNEERDRDWGLEIGCKIEALMQVQGAAMPRRLTLPILALCLALAACNSDSPPTPYPIESEADFIAALTTAGAEVADTALVGWPQFGSGRAYQVNQALVYVYEYEDASQAQAVLNQLSNDGTSLGDSQLPWQNNPHIWQKGRVLATYDGDDGGIILLLNGLLGDFVNREPQATDEPYPPGVAVVISKFLDIRHLEPGEIDVLSFEPVTWPSNCLGMPGANESCIGPELPGWIVTLQIGDETLIVHTDEFGEEVRWEPLVE